MLGGARWNSEALCEDGIGAISKVLGFDWLSVSQRVGQRSKGELFID